MKVNKRGQFETEATGTEKPNYTALFIARPTKSCPMGTLQSNTQKY